MPKIYRRTKRIIKKPGACFYCKQKTEPVYKDIDTIRKVVTERGKIIGRMQSGVCQKHQKMLALAVKRARYLALIPYITRPT